jgi:hypothetical protein
MPYTMWVNVTETRCYKDWLNFAYRFLRFTSLTQVPWLE